MRSAVSSEKGQSWSGRSQGRGFRRGDLESSAEKQEAQPSREDEGGCFRQREPPGERLGMFVTTAFQMSSFRESLGGICF